MEKVSSNQNASKVSKDVIIDTQCYIICEYFLKVVGKSSNENASKVSNVVIIDTQCYIMCEIFLMATGNEFDEEKVKNTKKNPVNLN